MATMTPTPIRVRAKRTIRYDGGHQWHDYYLVIPAGTLGTLENVASSYPHTGTALVSVRWDYALIKDDTVHGHTCAVAHDEIERSDDTSPFLVRELVRTNELLERLVRAVEGYTECR